MVRQWRFFVPTRSTRRKAHRHMPSNQRPMKEGLDRAAVERIADNFRRGWRPFPRLQFVKQATTGLNKLELKQRVDHVIAALGHALPDEYPRAIKIVTTVGQKWDRGDESDPLAGFAAWPVIDYVAAFGLEHPELSLAALAELTPLFSAEFAIRAFILQHEPLTLATLSDWTSHADHHVRRLVSEGTRPRLPWGQRLVRFVDDPRPAIALLDRLRDDETEYVRRSVGNHLNDIAKDHPELVIRTCRRWQRAKASSAEAKDNRTWIIGRATRTLVKDAHPDVWPLLGYADPPEVRVTGFRLTPKAIRLGEAIHFTAKIRSEADTPQRLAVDYAVHHVKAAGHTSAKVFKLRDVTLAAGASLAIDRRHAIEAITTRRYHSGRHTIELRINGQSFGRRNFQLDVE